MVFGLVLVAAVSDVDVLLTVLLAVLALAVGMAMTIAPVPLSDQARRRIQVGAFLVAGVCLLWLLWLVSPFLPVVAVGLPLVFLGGRALLRSRRRENAVVHNLTIQSAAHVFSGGNVQVTVTAASPWRADASESPGLHEMYPHTRGVLLWCRHRDRVPEGSYLCDVTYENKTGTAKNLTPKSDGRLDCIYPSDFADAPSLPLRDGKYRVEWFRDHGVGREGIAEVEFERRRGKLIRPYDKGN